MLGVGPTAVVGLVMAVFFSPEIANSVKRRRRRQARRRDRDGFD
ncbi:hypothetical protein [Brevundimonas denitrificans]|nr:hypothetical protein [Brevundimonas denitrificans]